VPSPLWEAQMHEGRLEAVLWTAEDAAEATGGRLIGADSWLATGLSIDTRSLEPGDLFVALQDARDGHDFVEDAFAKGAAAALVSRPDLIGRAEGRLLLVPDTLEGLRALARAARRRSGAKRAAITGSVGKTSVKEALAAALARSGATHAAVKSFNNHIGVPLTLARMPPGAAFGVFEIGMNHRGEILPLSELVAPQLAMVTTAAGVHLEALGTIENIAREKGDIYGGLEQGGAALVPLDAPHADILLASASRRAGRVIRFGRGEGADARLLSFEMDADGSTAEAELHGRRLRYRIGAPGAPWALNGLLVIAATEALTGSPEPALEALAALQPAPGRGQALDVDAPQGRFTLIDDAYNASPVSVAAAIETLAARTPGPHGRRVVALGDMLELGPEEAALHAGLAEPILRHGVERVYAAGPRMAALWDSLPMERRGAYAPDADSLIPYLVAELRAGDIILIKGSNGSRMGRVVAALRALGAG